MPNIQMEDKIIRTPVTKYDVIHTCSRAAPAVQVKVYTRKAFLKCELVAYCNPHDF